MRETIVVGFAYSLSANANNTVSSFTPQSSAIPVFFSAGGANPPRLKVNSDWSLTIGSLTTSPNVLINSEFSYIEIKIDYATGVFELWINNVSAGSGFLDFGVGDKILGFGNVFNSYSSSDNSFQFFDDIYVLDDTGTTHNQRLGPVRAVRVPFRSTTEANFTPFGAADNITAINKDNLITSTFNRSPASNNVGDYFNLDTSVLPTDRPIIAVQ